MGITAIIGLALEILVPIVKFIFASAEERKKIHDEIMRRVNNHKERVERRRNKREEGNRQRNDVTK